MNFSVKNIRSQRKSIQKVQNEIGELQKLNRNLLILADNFRKFDREEKVRLFKEVSIVSINYSKFLVSNTVISGYQETELLITKNFIMKKILEKHLFLLKEKSKLYESCVSSANEFLRRVGWDLDMN